VVGGLDELPVRQGPDAALAVGELRRSALQLGGGTLGSPCTAGNKIDLQAWFRDPTACRSTNLSNAVELTYQP